jgi:hypothetical protein
MPTFQTTINKADCTVTVAPFYTHLHFVLLPSLHPAAAQGLCFFEALALLAQAAFHEYTTGIHLIINCMTYRAQGTRALHPNFIKTARIV